MLTVEAMVSPTKHSCKDKSHQGSLNLLDQPLHALLEPLACFGTAGLDLPWPVPDGWQGQAVSNLHKTGRSRSSANVLCLKH